MGLRIKTGPITADGPLLQFLIREKGERKAKRLLRKSMRARSHRSRYDARYAIERITEAEIRRGRDHVSGIVWLAPGVTWKFGKLVVSRQAQPQTVLTALGGQPLEFLVQSPLLGAGLTIARAENDGEDLSVSVTNHEVTIDHDAAWPRWWERILA